MSRPTVKSGKFSAGVDCIIGENVTVDVAEEVVLGDRCVIGDNTYLCGRSVKIGDDFYGYSHWNKRLEVGLGRRSEEDAVLTVGSRCTFHDNKIDLARHVKIGDDVGLSPKVTIYTHGYWLSCLEGFPCVRAPVAIGDGVIVGYRSTVLAGVGIPDRCVIGAGSVMTKTLTRNRSVYGGVPAKYIKPVDSVPTAWRPSILADLLREWNESMAYRGFPPTFYVDYPTVYWTTPSGSNAVVDVDPPDCRGDEDEYTDDLRWHLFCHGIRIYTKRPFKKLEKR